MTGLLLRMTKGGVKMSNTTNSELIKGEFGSGFERFKERTSYNILT